MDRQTKLNKMEWWKKAHLYSEKKTSGPLKHDQLPTSKKSYIRRNNNKVDSIETGHIVIADLFPWSDLEKCMYTTLF